MPFLDVLVKRSETGIITTSIYKKPTHTDQYLNFNSYQPKQHKASVVNTLLHRTKTLITDEEERIKEIKSIKENLIENDYPKSFIENLIKKNDKPRLTTSTAENPKIRVTLPYIERVSETIRRIFKPYDVSVNFKSNYILKNKLTKIKDDIPNFQKSNVVYQINCSDDNCSKKYIGETQQRLEKRIKQHRAAIIKGDERHSGISEHCIENLHFFNEDNVKILKEKLPYYKPRKLAEAFFIRNTDNNCNRDLGVHIPEIYLSSE